MSSLPPGRRLGPYEVLSPLGAGGMGEVLKAKDTRLQRTVALKVLPTELSSDAERRSRFEREAHAASALNHPNITTVFDIGEDEGTHYIVMELVEGKTLRELMDGGPLSTGTMLPLATQIAEGLAKAHGAGIVHRDLKPENVMVTDDGLVKILDFGLAKLMPEGSDVESEAPTETKATQEGAVLGTVPYMSPEQAAGRRLDYRSDQFSFGSILYEMATGKRAFRKETVPETLAAIIEEDPEPIRKLNESVPVELSAIVERCLAKDPGRRYDSTGELAPIVVRLLGVAKTLTPLTHTRPHPDILPGAKKTLQALNRYPDSLPVLPDERRIVRKALTRIVRVFDAEPNRPRLGRRGLFRHAFKEALKAFRLPWSSTLSGELKCRRTAGASAMR